MRTNLLGSHLLMRRHLLMQHKRGRLLLQLQLGGSSWGSGLRLEADSKNTGGGGGGGG